jgi:hypothetical protein
MSINIDSIELTRERAEATSDMNGRDILVVWQAVGASISVVPKFRPQHTVGLAAQFDNWIKEYREALEKVDSLDLSHRNIHVLPYALGRLSHLKQLHLQHNALSSLPNSLEEMTHLEHLDISHNQLIELDEEFIPKTLRYLNVGYNQISHIPAPYCQLHEECFFNIEHNPLSMQEISATYMRITQISAAHPELHLGPNFFATWPQAQNNPQTLEGWVTYWLTHYKRVFPNYCQGKEERFPGKEFLPFYDALFTHEERGYLEEFLKRLRKTQDYKNGGHTKKNIIFRVGQMLQEAATNEAFREGLFPILKDATSSCGERVAFAFNEIEILTHLCQAKDKTDLQLAHLLIGIKRIELLKLCANTRCLALGLGDEVEIHIYYQVKLNEILHLPVSTELMLYPDTAKAITHEMLKKDAAFVWLKSHTHEQYIELLLQYPVWIERLQKNYGDQFGAINAKISDQITEIMETKPGSEWDAAINALKQEQKTQTNALALKLTKEWVEKNLS